MPKQRKVGIQAGGGDLYEWEYDPGTGPRKHGNALRWRVADAVAELSGIANWLARCDFFRPEGDERPFWIPASETVQRVADRLASATGGKRVETADQP